MILRKGVFLGQFQNDYAGYQQYTLGVAATVAKVGLFFLM